MVVRCKHPLGNLLRYPLRLLQASPKLIRRREVVEIGIFAGQKIVFDDAMAVGGIGELESKDLGILFGLLESVPRMVVDGLCLYNREREVAPVFEEVVGSFLGASCWFVARNHDTAICEAPLFTDLVVVPARSVELRDDVLAASVCFGEGHE